MRRRKPAPGQRKIDDIELPRANHKITLREPIPFDSVQAISLSDEARRIARDHHYGLNIVKEVDNQIGEVLTAIELSGALEQHKNDLEDLATSAVTGYKYALELQEIDAIAVEKGKGGTIDFEKIKAMCRGCPKMTHDGKGRNAKRMFADCLAASRLNGGKEGSAKFRREKRDHIKQDVTRFMEKGSNAHAMLLNKRNPVTDTYELVKRLANGERVIWLTSFCTQSYGLRAKPDAIVSVLKKVDVEHPIIGPDGYRSTARSGWLLQHVIIEDKRAPREKTKDDPDRYWPEINAEAMMLTDERVLLHDTMPHESDVRSMETPGVRLIQEIMKEMKIPITEVLHVEVFTALNYYWKPDDPVDGYCEWVLKAPRPMNSKVPLPRKWSEDHVVLNHNKWAMQRVLKIKKDRFDALGFLQTDAPTTQTHMSVQSSLPTVTNLEGGFKLVRPRTEEEMEQFREERRKKAEERIARQQNAARLVRPDSIPASNADGPSDVLGS